MSPNSRPSGWGSAYAITSVKPRRPVARRLARRIAVAGNSVISTCEPAGARSHAITRSATRISSSARGRRVPGRTDAATGLRVIDAIVVHPAQDSEERGLDLLHLLQGERGFIELARVDLGAHDVVDRFLDLLRGQVLEDAQRGFNRVGDHRNRGLHRPRLRTRIGEVLGIARLAAVGLLRLVEEVGDLRGP